MKSLTRLILSIAVALILSTGVFAYTYTSASGTIEVVAPEGDVASSSVSSGQPDWDVVLGDLAAEGTVCNEVPTGNLFMVSPDTSYSGDVIAKVYLTNTGNLSKAFSYLNVKLYLAGSTESGGTPDYRLLTLQNGEAAFTIEDISATEGSWTETSQSDFTDSTLNQVDVTTSPGNVILDDFADSVTDTYDNEDLINASESANYTVSLGHVELADTGGSSSTEILRPDGTGDETEIETPPYPPSTHWNLVDDVTPDGDATYIETKWYTYYEDLYTMQNHSTGTGDIDYVRVYFRATEENNNTDVQIYPHIKTNGVEYNGGSIDVTTYPTYTTYYYEWANNPQTGNPWTWSEVDSLQIGVGMMRSRNNRFTRCTQVYAQVGYTDYGYYTSGAIESVNLLSSETVISIDSFDYTASAIPSGTGLQVQFSQDGSNWYNSSGTPGGFDTLSQGTNNIDLSVLGWSGSNFYYYMVFTSDGGDTPILDEITVTFSTYYASGDLISSSHDNGYDLPWNYGTISFTVTEPASTDVKFQIRTASTEGGLSSATWYGPTGTGDYYQTSATEINSVHDGDRWVQYRAYLTGPGDDTPIFSDVTITYSAQSAAYTIEIVGGGYCLVSDNISEWTAGWSTVPEFYCDVIPR